MSKAVMISIRPKWCEKICSGEKTNEVRKTRPKLETPFKCYIYCTSGRPDLNIPISPERLMQDYLDTGSMKSLNCPLGNGKVIGEFVCDRIYELETRSPGGSYYVKGEDQPTTNDVARQSCLSLRDMHDYLHAQKGYGWHISNLKIYDTPKKLSEFKGLCKVESDCCACPYYNYSKMDCDGRTIKRPPQSWCYVEATKDV
mgnify:CR=1 FL=1|jgi:predicted transcriptional regulator